MQVVIWDSSDAPSADLKGQIVLWRSYSKPKSPDTISISTLIEANADSLRSSYLSWIYELGQTSILGKRLVDLLELRPGFSYWWMTLLVEKCNYGKSNQIDDAIKVLALETLFNQQKVKHIKLVTSNTALIDVFQDWCDNNDVHLNRVHQEVQLKSEKITLGWLYKRLPKRAQSFVWLFHKLVCCWSLSGVGVAEWRLSSSKTSFVSYFSNLVADAAEQGNYESLYWANLPNSLAMKRQTTRWLHIFVKNKVVPTAKVARQLIKRFNCKKDTGQVHVTLESFLGLQTVWKTFSAWLRLQWRARKVCNELSKSKGNAFNLWLLLRDDWHDSIKGSTAMSNLLILSLFEKAFGCIPKQLKGCYLQENQGWEMGLISAWNHANHKELIGVQHSTIRYWDLRYFFDPRSYNQFEPFCLPLPSKVAVNGPISKNKHLEGGYPSEQLVDVEAIRYTHLKNKDEQYNSSCDKVGMYNLLVLGDFLSKNTALQMSILENAVIDLHAWKIVIKPHPVTSFNIDDYPSLTSINISVTDQPISELLPDFNVAYTSPATSAAVDAYCSGLSVISALDPVTLNFSSLRGIDGVQFVSNSEELLLALRNTDHQTEPEQFFFLDSNLPRWKNLLFIT